MVMDFLAYELKAAMVFALFYMFFRLLLSKETLHAFNRFMILSSCFIALVIPLCELKVERPIVAISLDALPVLVSLNEQIGQESQFAAGSFFSFENISLAIFIIGFLVVMACTAVSVIQILLIIKHGEKICRDGNKIVLCREKIVPMSWMNYIIISKDDYSLVNESVLLHERAHIKLKHSWDILFIELFTAVQWFNPAAWMMRGDLRAIHEYEADEYVINSGIDAKQYQLLLVKKAVGVSGNSVSNSFNHSTLKKRITMMLSKKSSVISAFKALYVLPLVGICLTANATGISSSNPANILESGKDKTIFENSVAGQAVLETNQVVANQQNTTLAYADVEVKPTFQDGDVNEFVKWVFTHIVYPQESWKNKEQGRVYLSMIIDTDGSVKDVKVEKGVTPLLDAEAVRVVSSSPKWTPGYIDGKPVKVKYSLPIIFLLK